MSVLESVVEKNWCIGCGMCAAVCPMNRLELRWNECGELNPVEICGASECGANCSLCYDVCPAHGHTKNETDIGQELYAQTDGIGQCDETGYYLNSYVGYSEEHRLASASGGLATWTLERLLETGEVDAVAAVGRTMDLDKLFEFTICNSVDEVRACSRSAYYPVEVSQVIQHILNTEGSYAIIGLPCVCKAIRLAQDIFPKLKTRIKYVLGLACGHTCSKFLVEYICALGGGDPHQLKEFIFRTKDVGRPASNIGMTFCSGDGKQKISRQILWKDGVSTAFVNGFFQIPGCFHCDDTCAECADVVFMDAWLPDYSKQPAGNSIALVRDSRVDRLFTSPNRELNLKPLDIGEVVRSILGAARKKRVRKNDPQIEPRRRIVSVECVQLHWLLHRRIRMKCAAVSPRYWNDAGKRMAQFSRTMLYLQVIIWTYDIFVKCCVVILRTRGLLQRTKWTHSR